MNIAQGVGWGKLCSGFVEPQSHEEHEGFVKIRGWAVDVFEEVYWRLLLREERAQYGPTLLFTAWGMTVYID